MAESMTSDCYYTRKRNRSKDHNPAKCGSEQTFLDVRRRLENIDSIRERQ